MSMAISNWGADKLDWLDGDTGCTGGCYNNPSVKFSNIEYKTANNQILKQNDIK